MTNNRCPICGQIVRRVDGKLVLDRHACLPMIRTRRRVSVASRVASREEQHGRYLDCGPGAWDDR